MIAVHIVVASLWLPAFLLAFLVKAAFWVKVLYRQRRTLAYIPGPSWSSLSRFWIVKTLASGNSAERFAEVNRRFGSLARIGPRHLITSDPDLTRKILGVRSGYLRGPWFDSLRIDPHQPNIVSERDAKKHSKFRQKLMSSFTGKAVQAMEPLIDEQLLEWMQRVEKHWLSNPGEFKRFDIGRRIQYLTVDIITRICLGEELGDVASDSDKYGFLATVELGNSVCQYLSVLLELNTVMYYFTKIPFLGRLLVPKPSDASGVGKIMAIVQRNLDQRAKAGTPDGPNMQRSLLQRGVPVHQISEALVVSMVAGSDTTSTAVQSTLLAIITNPRVYHLLKAEVKEAVVNRQVSCPIQEYEAQRLPYLQACILEGLRVHPPISQLRERVVPPQGDTIKGYHVPGGTYIGLNAWGTQLDEVYGADPELFRPERWLEVNDGERLKRMLQTHELIFGYGSTKCLGVPMAMMELHKVIFEIIRRFEITIASPFKPWSSVCYGIFFQKDFHVRLTRSTF